jgi:hypothetical protein
MNLIFCSIFLWFFFSDNWIHFIISNFLSNAKIKTHIFIVFLEMFLEFNAIINIFSASVWETWYFTFYVTTFCNTTHCDGRLCYPHEIPSSLHEKPGILCKILYIHRWSIIVHIKPHNSCWKFTDGLMKKKIGIILNQNYILFIYGDIFSCVTRLNSHSSKRMWVKRKKNKIWLFNWTP